MPRPRSHPPAKFTWLPVSATAIVLLLVLPAGSTPRAAAASPATAAHRVTLVTGDVVTFTDGARPLVSVEQAPGRPERQPAGFRTSAQGRGFYVIPADAEPLLTAGTLDRELFNVRGLVRQGLTDTRTKTLPVIVTYPGKARAGTALPATQAHPRDLPSVNGVAAKVERARAGEFWAALTGRSTAAQVKKIWLDQRLKPALDVSVPQIGAPELWSGGQDGTGVTVAVLDTGIDATHPDVAGRIVQARSFVEDDPGIDDASGHGTHVASILAGSGAASGGRYKGVAPGADLAVGKVCGVDDCPESAVLLGLDWAAHSGAKVVNVSLGGAPSDGTDLLSERINQLTAETGTLFVVAAGNDGTDLSVGSPGAASAALTVGAVDKADRPATFSSGGPRLGDAAVKPEITAPGVTINAARAKDTWPGEPGDGDQYVKLSGTSMATPHVAGAAAILAQAQPDLTAATLKNALTSTAKDVGSTWYRQGAGRVDVVTANGPLTGPASLTGGRISAAASPVQHQLSYRNRGDSAVTLTLAIATKGWDGRPSLAARLSTGELVVPARAEATATLTIDAATEAAGIYGGVLTAVGGGTVLRTPVSWYREPAPVTGHSLTIKLIDRQGRPLTTGAPRIIRQLSQADLPANDPFDQPPSGYTPTEVTPGTWKAVVAEGDYMAVATQSDLLPQLARQTVLTTTNVAVRANTQVTLDARKAVRAATTTAQPSYTYDQQMSVDASGLEGWILLLTTHGDQTAELWATPTPAPSKGRLAIQETYTLGEHTVRARSFVGGQETTLHPQYLPFQAGRSSPGQHQLPVAYAGSGSPADFAVAGDLKGKAVLVRLPRSAGSDWWYRAGVAQEEAALLAKKAGASALLTYLDAPGARPLRAIVNGPDTIRLLVLGLSHAAGEQFRTHPNAAVHLDVKANPDRLYHLHYAPPFGVPAQLHHEVQPTALRMTRNRYHAEVPGLTGAAWTFAAEDDRHGAFLTTRVYFQAPAAIDQYHGGDSRSANWVRLRYLTDGMSNTFSQYDWKPSRGRTESWFSGPLSMVEPDQDQLTGSHRVNLSATEDALVPSPYLGDSSAGHFVDIDYGSQYPFGYRLFRGETEIPARRVTGQNTPYFAIARDTARYRLDGTYTLPDDGRYGPNKKVKQYSTKVHNQWSFTSRALERQGCPGTTLALCHVPPLLQLRYDLRLELDNRVRGSRPHRIGITAVAPQHADGAGKVRRLTLAWSTDSGQTWHPAGILFHHDGRFSALTKPAGQPGTAVWLRVHAEDNRRNTVTQTIENAYTIG